MHVQVNMNKIKLMAIFGLIFIFLIGIGYAECEDPILKYKKCVDSKCGTGILRQPGCDDSCKDILLEEQNGLNNCTEEPDTCSKHACQVTLTSDYEGVSADGVSSIKFTLVLSGDYEDFSIELRSKNGENLKGKTIDMGQELIFIPDQADKNKNYLEPQTVEAVGWCAPKQASCETQEPDKQYSRKDFTVEQPPIFFVHGVLSSAETWTSFERMAHEGGWQYDDISYPSGDNVKNAQQLSIETRRFITNINHGEFYNNKRISATKLDIVSHSMGGLVTRQYIGSKEYDENIRKFVMIGTPNHGSWGAQGGDWLAILTAGMAVALVPYEWYGAFTQLKPDNDFINRLNLQSLNPDIEYRTIAGTGWSTFIDPDKPSTWRGDGVVLVDSVRLSNVPLYCTYDAHSSEIFWVKPGILTSGASEWTTSKGGALTSSILVYRITRSLLLTGVAEDVTDCNQEFIPKNQFIAWLRSPATLHAYDENGNHVGLDKKGKFENTIGDGVYYNYNSSEIEGQVIKIVSDKKIMFVVKGYETGNIGLEFTHVEANGSIVQNNFENISIDKKTQYTFDASSEMPELIKQEVKTSVNWYMPAIAILVIVCGVLLIIRSSRKNNKSKAVSKK